MEQARTPSQQYCADLVSVQDEDRWLACGYASAPLARSLIALYAVQIELRRVPAAVSEPPLGEIRLQWWREAFAEIRQGKPARAHPVVEEIAATGLGAPALQALVDEAIDARARPFYGEPFADAHALERWLSQSEGAIDALAVMLAGGDAVLAEAARRAGTAFALAREGRALAPQFSEEVLARADRLLGEAAPELKAAAAGAAPALLHLALTGSYLRRRGQPFPLTKRMRLFTAMAFGAF